MRPEEQVRQSAFTPVDSISSMIGSSLLGGPAPRMIRQLGAEARHGAVQRERLNALGIGRGEQDAHRAALGDAEQRCGVDPDRIHHGVQVVHPLVEWRHVSHRIGQPGAALVPHDQPGPAGEAFDERHERQRRVGPQVDIAEPAGDPHQRGVALAEHAIGQPHRAVARVVHSAVLHAHILTGACPRYAAKPDMAHAGIDHLRSAGGGPVAQAVAVGAQKRAALDDLARYSELRLPRVVTVCLAARRRRRRVSPRTSRWSTPRRCPPCRKGRSRWPGSCRRARCVP